MTIFLEQVLEVTRDMPRQETVDSHVENYGARKRNDALPKLETILFKASRKKLYQPTLIDSSTLETQPQLFHPITSFVDCIWILALIQFKIPTELLAVLSKFPTALKVLLAYQIFCFFNVRQLQSLR